MKKRLFLLTAVFAGLFAISTAAYGVEIVQPERTRIPVGLYTQLETEDPSETITWSSSNESIAVVTDDGLVKPKAHGAVTVTATAEDGTEDSIELDIFRPAGQFANNGGAVVGYIGEKISAMNLQSAMTPHDEKVTFTFRDDYNNPIDQVDNSCIEIQPDGSMVGVHTGMAALVPKAEVSTCGSDPVFCVICDKSVQYTIDLLDYDHDACYLEFRTMDPAFKTEFPLTVPKNMPIAFDIVAKDGYRFSHWEDESGNVIEYSDMLSFRANSNMSVRPVFFSDDSYKVFCRDYRAIDGTNPIIHGEGIYQNGDTATFSIDMSLIPGVWLDGISVYRNDEWEAVVRKSFTDQEVTFGELSFLVDGDMRIEYYFRMENMSPGNAHYVQTAAQILDENKGSIYPSHMFSYGMVPVGEEYLICAIPKAGYAFDGWYDSPYGAQYGGTKLGDSPTMMITAEESGPSYWAIFSEKQPCTINVDVDYLPSEYRPVGSPAYYDPYVGTVTGPDSVLIGDIATIKATSKYEGYHFDRWIVRDYSGESFTVSYQNPYSFDATEDQTYYAVFEPDDLDVTFHGETHGSATPNGSTYWTESSVSYEIKPDQGYRLKEVSISENGRPFDNYDLSQDGKTLTISNWSNQHSLDIYLTFKEAVNYTISQKQGHGSVTGLGTYTEGDLATVTFTPDSGFKFIYWKAGDEIVSYSNPFKFTVDSDMELWPVADSLIPPTDPDTCPKLTLNIENKYWTGYRDERNCNWIIPELVQHEGTWYQVTGIGKLLAVEHGFTSECWSVTIPDSITTLPWNAFNGFSLYEVHLPDTITDAANLCLWGMAKDSFIYTSNPDMYIPGWHYRGDWTTVVATKYDLSLYDYNGETPFEVKSALAYDAAIALPTDRVWKDARGKVITSFTKGKTPDTAVALYAEPYTVQFVNDDGTVISSTEYAKGATPVVPANPTKEQDNTYTYSFAGWDKTVQPVTEDVTYTAVYTPIYREYEVSFLDANGDPLVLKRYHYGDEVTAPKATKPADAYNTYTHSGWTPELKPCDGDVVYTPVFTSEPILYTVKFLNYDGTELSTQQLAYGATVDVPDDPSRPDGDGVKYEFAGWSDEIVAVDGDKTYTAAYDTYFRIVFADHDGTELASDYIKSGEIPTLPEDPVRAADSNWSYVFDTWTPAVAPATGPAVYTASYTSTAREYTVTFLNEDGSEISSAVYHFGDEVTAPVVTMDSDVYNTYTHTGWTPELKACDGDISYTAVFEATPILYTIVFEDYDGTELLRDTFAYGAEIVAPEAPERAAEDGVKYEFSGWSSEVTNVTGDMTYTAVYSTYYLVSFVDHDGVELSSGYVKAGDLPAPPDDPTRTEDASYTYEFSGWTPDLAPVTEKTAYTAAYTSTEKPKSSGGSSSSGSSSATYSIKVMPCDGGSVVTSRKTASAGSVVTITVKPDTGMELNRVWVENAKALEVVVTQDKSGKIAFKMPRANVEVHAEFVNEGTSALCLSKADCPAGVYSDFIYGLWHHDAMHYVAEHKLMDGVTETSFDLDGAADRHTLVEALWRLNGRPEAKAESEFQDVPDAIKPAIDWAYGEGFILGYGDGRFGPYDKLTREQVFTILYRYIGIEAPEYTDDEVAAFEDAADVSVWAKDAVFTLVKRDIVRGTGNGSLKPLSNVTRVEVAALLLQMARAE